MNQKRIAILKTLSALSTVFGLLLSQGWLLILLALLWVLDTTPHLRLDYVYQDYGHYRAYTRCTYVGVKGFITIVPDGSCPVVTLLSPHDERRIK